MDELIGEARVDLGLQGKVVLITGGSKGIGLACARAFAAEGAKVAIASRSQVNLDQARAELRSEGIEVFAVAADLTKAETASAMAAATEQALGPIDVLVNSAGASKRHALDQYDSHAWHQGMDSKFFPYVHAMDAVRASMVERKKGAVVNIIGTGGKRAQPTHLRRRFPRGRGRRSPPRGRRPRRSATFRATTGALRARRPRAKSRCGPCASSRFLCT